MDTLTAIATRRSTGRLNAPAPSPADLDAILTAATCAPDHGELRPWRFVILEGEHKDAFGTVLAEAYLARADGHPTEGQLEKERHKLDRAPLVLVVAAIQREHPTVPFTEQVASAAAAAQNALLAATALGYGSMWRTGDAARDPAVAEALGLSPNDQIMGFLYLGTSPPGGAPRPREARTDGAVEHWRAPPEGGPGGQLSS